MPVFDFNDAPDKKNPAECTYTTFQSSEPEASPEKPILILDNSKRKWQHHSCGMFTNPVKRTTFEFHEEDGTISADILKIDARFVSLLKVAGRKPHQCTPVGRKPPRGLCGLQNPRDGIWRRNQTVRGGRIFTVYDRASVCKRCAGRGGSR